LKTAKSKKYLEEENESYVYTADLDNGIMILNKLSFANGSIELIPLLHSSLSFEHTLLLNKSLAGRTVSRSRSLQVSLEQVAPLLHASRWSQTTPHGGHGHPSSPTAQGSHLGGMLPASNRSSGHCPSQEQTYEIK